jgi:tRNA nucleotidyltransferase (CCA-adding enzyme)
MAELPSKFKEFLKKVRPTEQKDDYIDGHKTLRNHLESSDEIEDIHVTDFLQGSYRRWTAVKPQEDEKSDVDVVFVAELDEDIEAVDALSRCEPFLDEHYEGKWSPNAHSYKIEEDLVEIDLVLTSVPSEETRETLKDLGSLGI